MNKQNFKLLLLAILFFSIFGMAKSSQANTINAASCSQADVITAISSANSEDTINVPAGTCTWNSTLTITKGVILKGAGVSATTITSNVVPAGPSNTFNEGNYLIVYKPANPVLDEPFRLTGFTLNFNNQSAGVMITSSSATPIGNIRIDHNIFENSRMTGGSARTLLISGGIYGVIDNNTFLNNLMTITSYGNDNNAWSNLVFSFGSKNCIYYEDNIFSGQAPIHDAGAGSTYCARYNTYNGTASMYPWFDMHGNQPNAHHASMGAEIYGNVLNLGSSGYGTGIFDQRGGKAVIFGNNVNTSGSVSEKVREEYDDAINLPATGPEGQPQHVSDSYFWNNRKNSSSLISAYIDEDDFNRALGIVNNPPVIIENVTHFNQNISFDGTAGVGCGPLANRPTTCSLGVGFWATSQSCTSISNANIGASPTEPISGTLYKCTAPNTWTAYYTPYTYPHPLRTAGLLADTLPDTTPPSPPTGLSVN